MGLDFTRQGDKLETKRNTYFEAVCAKCDMDLLIKETDRTSSNYYLCGVCAWAKVGW